MGLQWNRKTKVQGKNEEYLLWWLRGKGGHEAFHAYFVSEIEARVRDHDILIV